MKVYRKDPLKAVLGLSLIGCGLAIILLIVRPWWSSSTFDGTAIVAIAGVVFIMTGILALDEVRCSK